MNAASFSTLFDLEYYFELSPDLICIAGYDGYFKKVNPAVARTLGYSEEELRSRPIDSFIHPDDREVTARRRQSIFDNEPLLNFKNRYLCKDGTVVWLSWTSMPIKRDKLIFAIAKKIYPHAQYEDSPSSMLLTAHKMASERLNAEEAWIAEFEKTVRKYIGNLDFSLGDLSAELGMSERQLFRTVKRIRGITPNKLIQLIRLKVASEAIAAGKYRTASEISHIAGFRTVNYFSRLYKQVYKQDVVKLIGGKDDIP